MGLNCTHGAWDGGYISFMRLRMDIAEIAGISQKEYMILCRGIGQYPDTIDEGMYLFLNHSDCDGILTPEQCTEVAYALDKILPTLKQGALGADSWTVLHTQQFINGCLEAAFANENLEFR